MVCHEWSRADDLYRTLSILRLTDTAKNVAGEWQILDRHTIHLVSHFLPLSSWIIDTMGIMAICLEQCLVVRGAAQFATDAIATSPAHKSLQQPQSQPSLVLDRLRLRQQRINIVIDAQVASRERVGFA